MLPLSIRESLDGKYGIDLFNGLRASLDPLINPFYKTPAGSPYLNLTVRNIVLLSEHSAGYASTGDDYDYPMNRDYPMSNNLQGVTHDDQNWYFSQKQRLWRIPVSNDVNEDQEHFSNVAWVHGPPPPGYSHFGDLDYYDGRLYVPAEGDQPPLILVYDPTSLGMIAYAPLTGPQGGQAPWCAINPLNGLLFSSNFYHQDDEPGHNMCVYERRFNGDGFSLGFLGDFPLFQANGKERLMSRIQGGAISQRGHLYLVVDDGTGVLVFNTLTGHELGRIDVDYDPDDHSGRYEELEGITLWNLEDGRAPKMRGEIHLIMVGVGWQNDSLYFKHYRVTNPSDADKL